MKNNEINVLIEKSKKGNKKSINKLLEKYQDMIKGYSFINGEIVEELKQDLTEQTIKAIKKFKIFFNRFGEN